MKGTALGGLQSYFRIGFMPGIAVDMKGGVHTVYADNVTSGVICMETSSTLTRMTAEEVQA